jgi:predicted metal-dependent hydrolase
MRQETIIIRGETIPYTVRLSALARRITLRVRPGGEVLVSVPRRFAGRSVERFLRIQSAWLLNTYTKLRAIPIQPKKEARREYLALREEARVFVHQRLEYYRHVYGYDFGRVSIRNQATRWGSCSRSGNLSFNYRLVQLPPNLADYIIVHELCHRKELNHSSAFWALVQKAVPNFKSLRVELRKRGLAFS